MGPEGPGLSGVSYNRWGRTNCSGDAVTVYTGKDLKVYLVGGSGGGGGGSGDVPNPIPRIALTKLRLSNHKLAIETGHYSRSFKKPAERTCPICKIEIEDEYHFLI